MQAIIESLWGLPASKACQILTAREGRASKNLRRSVTGLAHRKVAKARSLNSTSRGLSRGEGDSSRHRKSL